MWLTLHTHTRVRARTHIHGGTPVSAPLSHGSWPSQRADIDLSQRSLCLPSWSQSSLTEGISKQHRVFLYDVYAKYRSYKKCKINLKLYSQTRKQFENIWKGLEQLVPLYAVREHAEDYVMNKNWTKLVLQWRHIQGNCWFVLQGRRVCLHDQYELQQSCCSMQSCGSRTLRHR
jgi:hypothetical protein